MRSAYHGHVVSQFGGVFSKPQSLDGRLDSGAGNQDLVRRSGFAGDLQDITAFLIGEHDRFARRPEYHNARHGRARVLFHVMFELFEVHVAVGIKRRRNGRENTVK